MMDSDKTVRNQYDQVDDFKWLKAQASPNWRVLEPSKRVKDEVWRDVVPGAPGTGSEDILRAVGVSTLSTL